MITYILEEKIKRSKEILKLASEMSKYYYHKPLIITYSGGKDDTTGKETLHKWTNGEEVFKWWIGDDSIDGQMDINDFIN